MSNSDAVPDDGHTSPVHPVRSFLRRGWKPRERASGTEPDVADRGVSAGSYLPALLCLIGVLLFARTGWVVGQAGLLGAMLILTVAFAIAGSTTALLGAAVTNARSGVWALPDRLIQAFGWEAGGMLAVPALATKLTLAGVFLYGFAEGWHLLFPSHPTVAVAYAAGAVVVLGTLLPRRHVRRIQVVAAIVLVGALLSMLAGLYSAGDAGSLFQPQVWGTFEDAGFWTLFALLFPVSVGIMVALDVETSDAEADVRLARGLLVAVGATFLLYLLGTLWYGTVASPFELRGSVLVGVQDAASGELVVAGLLAVGLVGALTILRSAVASLDALRRRGIIPTSVRLQTQLPRAEQTINLGMAALVLAAVLALGSLNGIAIMTTLFGLATVACLHAIVLVDQRLGAVAFRPTLSVPGWLAPLGLIVTLVALLSLNAVFAVGITVALGLLYAILVRHSGGDQPGTVRSGTAGVLSDWLGRQIVRHPGLVSERGWRPDVLVPVESRQQLDGTYRFLHLLAMPGGSLSILGVRQRRAVAARMRRQTAGLADRDLFAPREEVVAIEPRSQEVEQDLDLGLATDMFRRMELEASSTVIEAPTLVEGLELSAAVLRGTRIRPSLLFGLAHLFDEEQLFGMRAVAHRNGMGLALLYLDQEAGFGYEQSLNVWVSDRGPDWDPHGDLRHLNLALLLALQIRGNWKARLRLCTAVRDPRQEERARQYLQLLAREARLGHDVEIWTTEGRFMQHLSEAPRADLQIIGLSDDADLSFLRTAVRLTRCSSLFVRGAGHEHILA